MMPSLEEVVERFGTWRTNGGRVLVHWEGLATGGPNQKSLTAQVDGIVQVVEPDGGRTLVVVARSSNNIQMYLAEGCTVQTCTVGSQDAADMADVHSMVRITFPTGEACFVTFYNPLN